MISDSGILMAERGFRKEEILAKYEFPKAVKKKKALKDCRS